MSRVIDFCLKGGFAVKKSVISTVTATVCAIALYILVFQGFGFPNISPMVDCLLRFLAALCMQIFVLGVFRRKWLRAVPVVLTALLALWGGILFVGSDSWQGVRFSAYVSDYCTPFLGCCVAWAAYKVMYPKD